MSESMTEARRDVFQTFCMTTCSLRCLSIFFDQVHGVSSSLFKRLGSKMHLSADFSSVEGSIDEQNSCSCNDFIYQQKTKEQSQRQLFKLFYVGLNCKGCYYNLLIEIEKSVGKSQAHFFFSIIKIYFSVFLHVTRTSAQLLFYWLLKIQANFKLRITLLYENVKTFF